MLSISSLFKIINLKSKIINLVLFTLSLFSLLSAGPPDTLWTRTYGGAKEDIGHSVQQTSDGGFIVVGQTNSFSTNWGDVYIIKTNASGDTLWSKTYGAGREDHGYFIDQTKDSGYIITGIHYVPEGTESMSRVLLLKYNSFGDTLWTRKPADGVNFSGGKCIRQTSDGGYIITGFIYMLDTHKSSVYLVKTYENGDTIWTKKYKENDLSYDEGCSILQTSDDGFIIVGYTETPGDKDVYLIRTNSTGDTLWTKTFGGAENDLARSILLTSDSGFIMVGNTESFGKGKYDVYLIRTNTMGDTLWTKTYGGTNDDWGNSVQQMKDGGFVIVGMTSSFGDSLGDIYIIRTNSDGDTLWTNTVGGSRGENAASAQITSDDGLIIVGTTSSFGAGNGDVYLIRLDKDTTAIQQEIPSNFLKPNNFIVSQNHGNISIRYTIPYSTSVKLEAYDIKGKLVKVITDKFMNKGSYSVNWDSKRFGSGVYFLRLSVNGSEVSRKVTLIR